MTMPTVYARREPTTDHYAIAHNLNKNDIVIYSDPDATEPAGRFPWHMKGPTMRSKMVMLDCAMRPLMWLDEV